MASSRFGGAVSGAGDVNGDGYSDVIVGASYYTDGGAFEGRAFIYHGGASGLSTTADWFADRNQGDAFLGGSVSSAGDVNGDGYSDVIIGANKYDNGQADEGVALVYHGGVSGLSASPDWTGEINVASANYGSVVSTAGDVNGDGYADVIVATENIDLTDTDQGRAWVYLGGSSGLSTTAAWIDSGTGEYSGYGASVSTAGDVNGDGYSEIVVGAPYSESGEEDEGLAHVYYGGSYGLSTSSGWTAESGQADAELGFSASTAGDVNGDGFADIIVGARYYDNGQTNEGRAYLHYGSASGPSVSADWTYENDVSGSSLGYSVSSAGDVNGDGYSDVILGAPYYVNGQTDEGRAYVFHGGSSGPSGTPSWGVESNQESTAFGYSVASAGDVDGDGYGDIIVGAPSYDNGLANEGGAFVYFGGSSGLSTTADWSAEGNQLSANFGNSVSSAGDVNRDGYSDIIVGAYLYDDGQTNEGHAFVYHGSGTGPAASASWTAQADQNDAHFGQSVSGAGDVNGDGYSDVIVGAPDYDNGQSDEGRAIVYHGSGSGLSGSSSWTKEVNQASASFGYSVSRAGDINGDGYSDVIIGAPNYDNGETDEGRAYVYHGSNSGLSTTADWNLENDHAGAELGTVVASAGDVNGDGFADVLVGAPKYENGQNNEGLTLVYYGNNGTGLTKIPRQTNGDGTFISTLGAPSANNYRIKLKGRSPFGRSKVRLVWESKALGTAFDGTGLGTSSWTDVGVSGIDITGTVSGLSSGTRYHWRAKLQYQFDMSSSPWYSVGLNGAGETDLVYPDVVAPTVAITSSESSPTNASPIPVTITFNEAVTGFAIGDITVGNGTKSNFVASSATVYTVDVTPSSNGAVTVDVAGGVAVDGAGNGNDAATQLSLTYDGTVPTVSISSTAPGTTNVSPIPVTITFSESVTGFTVGEITVGNGSAGNFSGSGDTYTADITPSSDGTVTVDVASAVAADSAGNDNSAASQLTRTYDASPPTVTGVTSSTSNGSYDSGNTISIQVNFSEAVDVAGYPELTLETGAIDTTLYYGSGSGTSSLTFSYLVVTGNTSADLDYTGTTSLTAGGGTIRDTAGNNATLTLPAPGVSGSLGSNKNIVIDTASPSVSLSSTTSSLTNSDPIPVTVTFSESVTGFSVGDVSVTGGSVSSVSGSGAVYLVNITPSTTGARVTVSVSSGVASDSAGNPNTSSSSLERDYDGTAPTVTLSSTVSSPTADSPIPLNVTFSEAVTGFGSEDITVGNGTVTNITGTSATYTVTITPTAAGTVTVDVGAAAATDLAGNANTASSQFSITYSSTVLTAPSITSPTSGTLSKDWHKRISGTAHQDATVRVFDGDTSLGTADVGSDGTWSFTPSDPWSPGVHTVKARAEAGGADGEFSTPVTITVLSAELDYDADGNTDPLFFQKTKTAVNFKSLSTETVFSIVKPSATNASADYNGDGRVEFATVHRDKKSAYWSVLDRDTNITTMETFGKATETLLVGCNLNTSIKSEMAKMSKTTLSFKEFGNTTTSTVKFPKGATAEALVGCGDVSGDGIDEVFFVVPVTNKKTKKVTKYFRIYNLSKQMLSQKKGKSGSRAFAFDYNDDATIDIALEGRSAVSIYTLTGLTPSATATTSGAAKYSWGMYLPGSSASAQCLLKDEASGLNYYYYPGPTSSPVGTAKPAGYSLISPVNVLRPPVKR